MYKIIKDKITDKDASIHRLTDNAFIPFDPANTDYQEFLKWVAEGNEPAPPDEPESP